MSLVDAMPASGCADCCECLPPLLLVKTRAASAEKCGYGPFTPFVPAGLPRRFLTLDHTHVGFGRIRCVKAASPDDYYARWWDESSHDITTYRALDGSPSCILRTQLSEYRYFERREAMTSGVLGWWQQTNDGSGAVQEGDIYSALDFCSFSCPKTQTDEDSPTATSSIHEGNCDLSGEGGYTTRIDREKDTWVDLLQDEYTTDMLLDYLVSKLAAAGYGAFHSVALDTLLAGFSLSEDELTGGRFDSIYKFKFKIPKIGLGNCYRLEWDEFLQRGEGGSPPDGVHREWIWDGVVPEDYDPENPATWPESPEFTAAIPPERVGYGHATIYILGLSVKCTGCHEA